MQIKKMTAWFGTLDGKSLELGQGLNILYAPNESGKSTWCAFLRDMLYGVDTAQRVKQGQQPDKVKYRPWSGAPMSGSMDIETADGPVTLRRWTERAGQPMQAFSATVTGTDTPVADLTAETVGRVLTGAPREVFERSAFIHQSALSITSDPELEKRFAAIVSAGDEEQSYSETDTLLRAWQRRRTGRKGAVPELDRELARLRGELESIEAAGRNVADVEAELDAAQVRQAELVKRMEQARAAARKKALADYQAAKRETEAKADALRQAEQEKDRTMEALQATPFGVMGPDRATKMASADLDQVQSLTRQADKLPPRWPMFVPAGIGLVLLLAAPFSGAAALPLVVGALAFFVGAVALYLWSRDIDDKRDALLDQRMEILDRYGASEAEDIDASLSAYQQQCDHARQVAAALDSAEAELERARQAQQAAEEPVLNGLDFVNGDNEAARASRAVAEGQERIDRLREQRAVAEGRVRALGDPMELRSALESGAERRAELTAQAQALELAAQTMEQADLALREKFSPVLAEKAASLFGALTDGRYDEITLARDLSAKARLTGDAVGWETDYLSQGAKDQLYLALRLAVCSLVLPEEQACPIILDDALAAFDRQRMERALDLLKSVAEKRQVLLFTCHEREGGYFAQDPAVTKIALGA